MQWIRILTLFFLATLLGASDLHAGESGDPDRSASEMRAPIERYAADRSVLERRYPVPMSPIRRERMERFYGEWLEALARLPFEKMSREGQIDWILHRRELTHRLQGLRLELLRDREIEPFLPFAGMIVGLAEPRRLEPADPAEAAARLDSLREGVEQLIGRLGKGEFDATRPEVAVRAHHRLQGLKKALGDWFKLRDGYDPVFAWWVGSPHEAVSQVLDRYAKAVKGRLVKGDLIGERLGEEALLAELSYEMIPYTPAELIDIAELEFAWCDAEMTKASKQLGFDDWREAQEHVKSLHVKPGEQPNLIRELAEEAIRFLDERELVTVPDLCREVWRMEMLSPQAQRMSPYFLGGETVRVAFPTAAMSHRDKLMSLRGNNRHFVRAVVHHELIPGHHLQGFMAARHRTHRRLFGTPFYHEGWSLYWETQLWDLGFAKTPEDRIGMLFWRKHRCARIIFSLSFHLGKMTAEEAVEFLMDRVGHEKNNAVAEVRRSISGGYGPLYQAAYMLGGLQLRALHRDLVSRGPMKDREFHDAVLRQNSMPIEMVRAALTDVELSRDYETNWRFYDISSPAGDGKIGGGK